MAIYNTSVTLTGCSAVPPIPSQYDTDVTPNLQVTLKANVGKEFELSYRPIVQWSDGFGGFYNESFELSPDLKSATIDKPFSSFWGLSNGATLIFIANTVDAPVSYPTDSIGVNGCSFIPEIPDYYLKDDIIDVTLVADEGTQFDLDNVPRITWQESFGGTLFENFTIDESLKTATFNKAVSSLFMIKDNTPLVFTASTIPEEIVTKNYGSINAYVVTNDNLDAFSKLRFSTGEPTGYVDLGTFVNRLKRVYVEVPTNVETELKAGDYDTGIIVLNPSADRILVDFGEVVIPEKNGDTVDNLSVIQILLPFYGFIDITPDYIGKSINLVYDINIITGNGLAKLYSNGILFQTIDIVPSSDVLFRTITANNIIGSDLWEEVLMYGLEPYVYYKWYVSRNLNKPNNDYVENTLSSFNGFIKAEHVSAIHNPNIQISEVEEIYRLLEDGVYIE